MGYFFENEFERNYVANFTSSDGTKQTPSVSGQAVLSTYEFIGTKYFSNVSQTAAISGAAANPPYLTPTEYANLIEVTDACVLINLMTPGTFKQKITAGNYSEIYALTKRSSVNQNNVFFSNGHSNMGTNTNYMERSEALPDFSFLDNYSDDYAVLFVQTGKSTNQEFNPWACYYKPENAENRTHPRTLFESGYEYRDNGVNGCWSRVYFSETENKYMVLPLTCGSGYSQSFRVGGASGTGWQTHWPPLTLRYAYMGSGSSSSAADNAVALNPISKLWSMLFATEYEPFYFPSIYVVANGQNQVIFDGNGYDAIHFIIFPRVGIVKYLYDFGIPKYATSVAQAESTPYEQLPDLVMQSGHLNSLLFSAGILNPLFDSETKEYTFTTDERSFKISALASDEQNEKIRLTVDGREYIEAEGKILDFPYTMEANEEELTIEILSIADDTLLDTYTVEMTYTQDIQDVLQTTPGQPIMPVFNKGGTGNFTSPSDWELQQTNAAGTAGYCGTTYLANLAAFNDVKTEIWSDNFLSFVRDKVMGSGQDTIINCLLMPFNVAALASVSKFQVSNVYLGSHPCPIDGTGAVAYAVTGTGDTAIEIGPLTGFQKVLGGFLDEEGMTQCFINLPFVGLKQIDPGIVYEHTLKVKYLIDLVTGECAVQVLSNVLTNPNGQGFLPTLVPVYEFNGQVGIPVSFAASNMSEIRQNIGIEALKTLATAGAGAATATLVQGVSSEMSNIRVHSEGQTGSGLERLKSREVYLLFIRPMTAIPQNYNATHGRPSSISVALSSLKGFTVVSQPIIKNTRATENEKEELKALLQSGIRIK